MGVLVIEQVTGVNLRFLAERLAALSSIEGQPIVVVVAAVSKGGGEKTVMQSMKASQQGRARILAASFSFISLSWTTTAFAFSRAAFLLS